MKIFGINNSYNSPLFGSRKQEIREADKLQRKARAEFPMLSQTMADDLYLSSRYDSKNKGRLERITDMMHRKIKLMREMAEFPSYYKINLSEEEKGIPYILNLNMIRQLRLGNCKENAMAAMAVLTANGYFNSDRVELMYKMDFINKKTGEIEDRKLYPMDHSFVITDMQKGNKKGEQNYVVDPWLGFADGKEGAIARFKEIYKKRDYFEAESFMRNMFRCDKRLSREEFEEQYEIRTGFYFKKTEPDMTREQKEYLGLYAREVYKNMSV